MIGDEFAGRLSGRPAIPVSDLDDVTCPICVGPHGRCVGPDVGHEDMAAKVKELAVARGQQQTRRPPGRPAADPEKEAQRLADWAARQVTETPAPEPEVAAPPVAVADPAPVLPVAPTGDSLAGEVEPRAAVAPAAEPPVAAAVGVSANDTAVAVDPGVQTLSPTGLGGPVVDPDGGSPRFTDAPTLVRTGDGAFRTQGVDARAGQAPIPATDPTEVKDCYTVPAGVIDPIDDPHRPDPATSVLVSDPSQLIATGAWTSLPGGTAIVTTRRVLQVWYPMGTLSPSYSTVADVGAVLPRPVGAR